MPPKFRSKPPKGPVVPLYDPKRDGAKDPSRLAYLISESAALIIAGADRIKKPVIVDGYTARHLVEKDLMARVDQGQGRKRKYRLTLRGEAVAEVLREKKRFPHHYEDES